MSAEIGDGISPLHTQSLIRNVNINPTSKQPVTINMGKSH